MINNGNHLSGTNIGRGLSDITEITRATFWPAASIMVSGAARPKRFSTVVDSGLSLSTPICIQALAVWPWALRRAAKAMAEVTESVSGLE